MLQTLDLMRSAFTVPSFANLLVVFGGWILTPGRHAITETLVQTGVSGVFRHEAFHRLFSRASWCADEVGRLLFLSIAKLSEGTVLIALDDTVARGKGPEVFGLGCHLDASRSSRTFKVYTFGHCWVVLAIVVTVPFSRRPWALPVLFRLYRTKKDCKKARVKHMTRTELARQLLDVFMQWVPPERRVHLSADSAYCCKQVLRGQSKRITVLGSMKINSVLYALPPVKEPSQKGCQRLRGDRLPSFTVIAADKKQPWQTCDAFLYGAICSTRYKTVSACWHHVLGDQLVKVILVQCTHGAIPFRIFFSTDPNLSPKEILEGYARRWSIEVCFRDLKQDFGFGDSSARSTKAVSRTAPFVGLSYSILVLWFINSPKVREAVVLPVRPWYPHKKGLSFLDILRAAQAEMKEVDFPVQLAARRLPSKLRPRSKKKSAATVVRRAARRAKRAG